MARTKKGQVKNLDRVTLKVIDILKQEPQGIRFSDLAKKVKEAFPDLKTQEMVNKYVQDCTKESSDIMKPSRGVYILKQFTSTGEVNCEISNGTDKAKQVPEEEFYQPFCEYLKNELEECITAIPLGGRCFKEKWVTPDVIGLYTLQGKFSSFNVEEIVTAEIKTDITQLLTGFGQACSYKLFSHKVYLVIPQDSEQGDIQRIESLCVKFGLGLVLFDRNNKEDPGFSIRARASKTEPDYFYLHTYLGELDDGKLVELGLIQRNALIRKAR